MFSVGSIEDDNYLVLLPSHRCTVLSSAVLNGGLTEANSFLNLKVGKQTPPPWLPPEETLQCKATELLLPPNTIGMMTAASMASLGYSKQMTDTLTVECWVTSGLSNTRRVGDIADETPVAGTINILLAIHQPLTPAALVEAMMLLTEAKVTVIRDLGIVSPISTLPASGTGTDSHAVFCPVQPATYSYCGKHTKLGELIGKSVIEACQLSLEHSLSWSPSFV
ncbi:adenosylcobinamide amidohydrolase [Vibrio nitrifigilis]|uniref:Adenosylcobinamide amidohydrolase n=1 Tax=Vibrio nitrifigilis TaxID=2789781 RepID=A0ABS0GEQ8_9VIBR|nr:adenosylcobinamide amidohydrolase [Vibrio nitrifigilis]MBF9000728.1 adenosylcobinamide amidohydrolase [Vibrio nitrifigilis]